MTRLELLETLLHHLPEYHDPGRGGQTEGLQGSRVLHFSEDLDCAAFQQLDIALNLMRKLGKQQAVRYQAKGGANDGAEVSCSLATCRWHLLAWYIPERYEQPQSFHRKRHGRNETIRPKPQPIRHKDAREDRARAGLEWLSAHYDWTKAAPGLNWLRKEQKIHGLTHVQGIAA